MCGSAQEVHWRQAEEELASKETEALSETVGCAPDVGVFAANITDQPASVAPEQQTWLYSGIAQHSEANTVFPASTYYHGQVGDQSSVGAEEAAAKVAGHGVTDSGQWSPAELAAQAKAWADWAAWQAQSAAQPSQGSSHSHVGPSGAAAHPGSAAGQPTMVDAASSTPEQPYPAELAGKSKLWAEWADLAGGPAQHAARAQDHSHASQAAGATQGAAQAHQTAQAGDSEMVTVSVSMYKRYQALEWAEWHRQYESWQAQYSSWYACYEHWYSSYLAWYNVHGGSAS